MNGLIGKLVVVKNSLGLRCFYGLIIVMIKELFEERKLSVWNLLIFYLYNWG